MVLLPAHYSPVTCRNLCSLLIFVQRKQHWRDPKDKDEAAGPGNSKLRAVPLAIRTAIGGCSVPNNPRHLETFQPHEACYIKRILIQKVEFESLERFPENATTATLAHRVVLALLVRGVLKPESISLSPVWTMPELVRYDKKVLFDAQDRHRPNATGKWAAHPVQGMGQRIQEIQL